MMEKTEDEIIQNWKSRQKPLLSCCFITYNHEKFISQAIDGMLKQETDFPFEIIIHDDASTDGTAEIIKKYADKYPHIIQTILQKENQYSQKKNIMAIPIKEARGQYIATLEGDDYWTDPLKLQKQVDFLEKNSEYVCCYHNSMVINDNNEIVQDVLFHNPKDYSEKELLSASADMATETVVFRNIIEYPDFFKGVPIGDTVRWHLMGFYGKAKYLDNVGKSVYRRHEGGVWTRLSYLNKFEKNIFASLRIKENLIINHLPVDDFNRYFNQYIARTLTKALFDMKFLTYWKMLTIIITNNDLPFFTIFKIHLEGTGHKIIRKISNITQKYL